MSAVELMIASIFIPFAGAILIALFGSKRLPGGHAAGWNASSGEHGPRRVHTE